MTSYDFAVDSYSEGVQESCGDCWVIPLLGGEGTLTGRCGFAIVRIDVAMAQKTGMESFRGDPDVLRFGLLKWPHNLYQLVISGYPLVN